MAYCIKCGEKVPDNATHCPQCGAEIPGVEQETSNQQAGYEGYQQAGQQEYQQAGQQGYQQAGQQGYQSASEEYFNPEDVQHNKAMGVLAYIGILVLIPLLCRDKNSEYTKFHLNQGLVLFIASIIVDLLSGGSFFGIHLFFEFNSWIISTVENIVSLGIFIFAVVGIVYACRGLKKELPFIGQIKIIK